MNECAQTQRPVARLLGEVFDNYPLDFYIPPDYLEVLLEEFEGPLDLLLYIIKKKNFEISQLPIAQITHQYMEYLEAHRKTNQALAIEYLVMASTLIALKSRMLLPIHIDEEEGEERDPRADLAARLEAYARCQRLAQELDCRPRIWRDFAPAFFSSEGAKSVLALPSALKLYQVYNQVMQNYQIQRPHTVYSETYSIEESMTYLLKSIPPSGAKFSDLVFASHRPIQWYLSCFLGLLELSKQHTLNVYQEIPFGTIYVTWSYHDESSCY